MMIYGEPRIDRVAEFVEVNAYTDSRRATRGMEFMERVSWLRQRYDKEVVNAWFDAISPAINDLHRFDEVQDWLRQLGFADVTRTVDNRNLFVMAWRRSLGRSVHAT
jgi:hypothetical protein